MAETLLESVINCVLMLIRISVAWKRALCMCGFVCSALNMLVLRILGNYVISINPQAIRVVALAALGTLQRRGPRVH